MGCLEEGGDSGDRGKSRHTPLLALAPYWLEEGDLLEGERSERRIVLVVRGVGMKPDLEIFIKKLMNFYAGKHFIHFRSSEKCKQLPRIRCQAHFL